MAEEGYLIYTWKKRKGRREGRFEVKGSKRQVRELGKSREMKEGLRERRAGRVKNER